MSTALPLRGTPLYRYIPGVGRAVAVDTTVSKYSTFGGGVLVVDQVYGSDSAAALDPFNKPFLTIQAALNKATSGQTVYVLPGTYNETLVIPTGVALRGINTQTVIVQRTGVTTNTTLLTMGSNCRVEDMTFTISTSSSANIVGVEFPGASPLTAKLRVCVVNVTHTGSSGNATGVLAAGTSSTTPASSMAIRASTINVTSSSAGINRGILVSGPNRFSIRDTNVFVNGAGDNNVGVETTDAGAVAELRSSTISGLTTGGGTTHHDINRSTGTIYLAGTDLQNNDANGNSFSVGQAPAAFQWGVDGDLGNTRRYYLIPGTMPIGSLLNTAAATYTAASAFPFPIIQPSIIINIAIGYTGVLGVGEAITFNLHRNNASTPVLSLSLTTGQTTASLSTSSALFDTGDTINATLVTTGDPTSANATFVAIAGYY